MKIINAPDLHIADKRIKPEWHAKGMASLTTLAEAVVQALFGATRSIFGPGAATLPAADAAKQIPRTVDVESGETIQQPPAGDLFAEEEPEAEPQKEPTEEEKLKEILKDLKEKVPAEAKTDKGRTLRDAIQALIDDPKATVKTLNSKIDQLSAWMQSHGKAGAA